MQQASKIKGHPEYLNEKYTAQTGKDDLLVRPIAVPEYKPSKGVIISLTVLTSSQQNRPSPEPEALPAKPQAGEAQLTPDENSLLASGDSGIHSPLKEKLQRFFEMARSVLRQKAAIAQKLSTTFRSKQSRLRKS